MTNNTPKSQIGWAVRTFILFIASFSLIGLAKADYVEVIKTAHIYESASRQSEEISFIDPSKTDETVNLELVSSERVSGYYNISLPGSTQTGWVYKSRVRFHEGNLPNTVFASNESSRPSSLDFPTSWSNTKTKAARIYSDNRVTLYCGCDYQQTSSSGGVVDHSTCDFENRPGISDTRAIRLEWEHIVPASLMPARQHDCWENGSRGECERHGPDWVKQMIFDLHNLSPSVGQVNADRSNLRYGEIDGEILVFGQCDFEYSRELGIAEPTPDVRGDVARVWFYMNERYGVVFEDGEAAMFQDWSENDPVSDWEIEKNRRVFCEQGTFNSFVSEGPFICEGG